MAETSIRFGRDILSRDRRAAVRHSVRSLAYVELGEGNGGVALNVSEGGIAIQAVMALSAADLPAIRIQLAHSKKQIEARGRVAWTSNLRRLAGLEFVDLSEESRIQIQEWISLESADLRPIQSAARHDGDNNKKIIDPDNAGLTANHTTSAVVSQAGTATARPSSLARPVNLLASRQQLRPAVLPAAEVPPAFVPGPYQLVRQAPADISNRVPDDLCESAGAAGATEQRQADTQTTGAIDSDRVKISHTVPAALPSASVTARHAAEIPEDRYGLKRRSRESSKRETAIDGEIDSPHTAVWVCVFTLMSLGAGWLAGHGDWRGMAHRIRATVSTNAAVMGQKAQPALPPNTLEIEIVDANNHHWLIPMNPQEPSGATAPGQPIPGTVTHRSAIAIPKSTLSAPIGSRVAASSVNAIPPEVTSPIAEPDNLLPMSATNGLPVSSPIQRPQFAAHSGIQPGELIHKVDPAYPKAAILEKVEGVVKIVAVIGADGNVKDVQPLSGPRALIPAAMDAIRQWRYTPTLLNGQPIETQRQISVTFRLAQTF